MSLFAELRRRNVVRVGIAYVVIAWILAQVAEFAFENFGAPDWVLKTVVVILLLGLPLALFFAWAFEITPEGVKREKEVDREKSIAQRTGRKLDFFIIGALVVALGYFIWERQAVDVVTETPTQSAASVNVPAETRGPTARSIAVLPFVNMSSDEEQEWFSDGLTEEILNALARTPDLLVAARTSSFKFKGSNEDIPTIAKALGVAHVLEGSVRRARDQLRVTAQLIRASDGFHLWSQTYDRNPEEVISIQEDVAVEIAIALKTAMDPEALASMYSAGTDSVPAFNAYLQGLAYNASTLSTGDAYTFLSAREAFEQAVELDPEFALANWELAGFWEVQLRTNNIVSGLVDLPKDEMRRRFDDAIERAIEFEDDSVNVLRYRELQAEVQGRFLQALRLNTDFLAQRPNSHEAQDVQLRLLATLSMDDELFAAIREFQERDGYDILVTNNSLTFLLMSDDKEFMREFAHEALRRVGDSAFIQYQAHRTLLWADDIDGASTLVPLLASSS
jgi:TolB-like protein